jgi:DNA uptake protein ComE-like DNA-binding protein
MLRRFFYLQKSDRKILVALLVVAVVALTVLWLTGSWQPSAEEAAADSTVADRKTAAGRYQPRPIDEGGEERQTALFDFDPNTADSTALLQLGLERWQVRNIYRYRRAGGIYRRKEDFARLYGLTQGQYRRLEPHIRIGREFRPAAELVGGNKYGGKTPDKTPHRDSLRYPKKLEAGSHVVLNTADTAELRHVPGIGVYFANEIVNHGRFLGGYVSVDQLDEIPDFPKAAKQYFVISNAKPKKLNVNRLSLNELKRHPYINYYQARDIVDYRRLHGPIKSLQQLKLLPDFTPEVIKRLEPYVEY